MYRTTYIQHHSVPKHEYSRPQCETNLTTRCGTLTRKRQPTNQPADSTVESVGVASGRPAQQPANPHLRFMLQDNTEQEMVTKKKSKIPCLSLSSFLPSLEGWLCFDLYTTASQAPVAFTVYSFALTFLSTSGQVYSNSDVCVMVVVVLHFSRIVIESK